MGYVNPGAFGIISQIGYVLLLTVVSGVMFFFNPIKKRIKKLCKRTQKTYTADESANRME